MSSRYLNTQKINNNSEIYYDLLSEKKINKIIQYSTYNFEKLLNNVKNNSNFVYHTVIVSDRLYNISQKYYGSPEYGWVICYLNNKSNEIQIVEGDLLKIYLPISSVVKGI